MSPLSQALSLNLPCFPCRAEDKTPLTPNGFKDAVSSRPEIRALFGKHRGCAIGVPTGETSGVDVLDIDRRHGGLNWYEQHKSKLPATRIHKTPNGGLHLLFSHLAGLRNSCGKIASGVDVRAQGGYIIWWPASGFDIEGYPLSELPQWPLWLLPALFEKPKAPQPIYQRPAVKSDFSPRYVLAAYERELRAVASAHEGARNVTLHRAAIKLGTFVGAGVLASADVENALYQAALAAGLPAAGSIKTIKSGLRYGADRPRSIPENRRRAHAF